MSSGVGGIEAEAVMLGQPISMVLPEVVGYKLHGTPNKLITSTDIVLTVTKVFITFLPPNHCATAHAVSVPRGIRHIVGNDQILLN